MARRPSATRPSPRRPLPEHLVPAGVWQLRLELHARNFGDPIPLSTLLAGPFAAAPARFGPSVLGPAVVWMLENGLLGLTTPPDADGAGGSPRRRAALKWPAKLRSALMAGDAQAAVVRRRSVHMTPEWAAELLGGSAESPTGVRAAPWLLPEADEYTRWRVLRALAARFRASPPMTDGDPLPEVSVSATAGPTLAAAPGEVPLAPGAEAEAVRWLVGRGLMIWTGAESPAADGAASRSGRNAGTNAVRVTPLLAAWLRWVVTDAEEESPFGWPPPELPPRRRQGVLHRVLAILVRRLANEQSGTPPGEARVPLAEVLVGLAAGRRPLGAGEVVPAVAEAVAAGRFRLDALANLTCKFLVTVNGRSIDHLPGEAFKRVVTTLRRGHVQVPIGHSGPVRVALVATLGQLQDLELPVDWAVPAPAPTTPSARGQARKPKWDGAQGVLVMRGETKKLKGKAPNLRPAVAALHQAGWAKSVKYPRPAGQPLDTLRRCLSAAFKGCPIWVTVSGSDTDKTWVLAWGWRRDGTKAD